MTILRMTDDIHQDASNWRGRPFLLKHINNYLRFNYAYRYSANIYYNTPDSFISYYDWYYVAVTMDYQSGRVFQYIYTDG